MSSNERIGGIDSQITQADDSRKSINKLINDIDTNGIQIIEPAAENE
jgi:hypothetical protein